MSMVIPASYMILRLGMDLNVLRALLAGRVSCDLGLLSLQVVPGGISLNTPCKNLAKVLTDESGAYAVLS